MDKEVTAGGSFCSLVAKLLFPCGQEGEGRLWSPRKSQFATLEEVAHAVTEPLHVQSTELRFCGGLGGEEAKSPLSHL